MPRVCCMSHLDLESVGFAPRFYDVAPWLGAPDGVRPRCRPRSELAEHYLTEYARWGGCAVPVAQFHVSMSMIVYSAVIMGFLILQPRGLNYLWEKFKAYYRLRPYSYRGG